MFSNALPKRYARRCALVMVMAPTIVFAQSSAPVTLRDVVAAARSGNPDLRIFQFELKGADAISGQAAQRPAPEIGFTLENFGGTSDAGALKSAQSTLQLSQLIELGGKRAARISTALAQRDALLVAREAAELDVLAEVCRRFIAVLSLQEQQKVAKRATELAEATLVAAGARVKAAKSPHVERDRAAVALDRAKLEEAAIASRLEAARLQLAALWGADRPLIDGRPFGALAGDLFASREYDDLPTLMGKYRSNPDFLRFVSADRLRDAQLRLAATQRRADITLGAGLTRIQGTSGVGLVAGFSMPLFAGRRAQPHIEEAAARKEAVGAERDAAFIRATAAIAALHRELETAQATLQALDNTIQPRMEEALRETDYAFERGRYSYLELIDAQREYLDVRRARIEAGERVQLLATEIERLTAAPLTSP